MVRRSAFSIVLLLLAVLIPAGAQSRVSAGGVSLTPPSGWTRPQGSVDKNIILAVLAPEAYKGFRANVNVMIQEAPPNATPQMLLDENKKNLQKQGFKIASLQVITVGGHPAGRMLWSGDMKGTHLSFNSTFILAQGRMYLITGTALTENFARYAAALNAAANSVQIDR